MAEVVTMISMQRPTIPRDANEGPLVDLNDKILDYEESEEGDIAVVREFLFNVKENKVDQSALLDTNITGNFSKLNAPLIHYAVLFNCVEQVGYLLNMGISPNSESRVLRQTPLHWACGFDEPSVISLLIKMGVDMKQRDVSEEGKAAIHIAAARGNVDALDELIKAGCPVDYLTQSYSLTPLFFAVMNKQSPAVAFLIGKGANVNAKIKSMDYLTLVHLAVLRNDPECLKHLLKAGAKPAKESTGHLKPIHVGAIMGAVDCLPVLVEYKQSLDVKMNDKFKQCPFIIAAEYGHVLFMRKLKAFGADPEARDGFGNTALHGAALYGNMQAMKFLLEETSLSLKESFDGKTPLHYAAAQSDAKLIEMLVLFGANVKAEDKMGMTPLHCAARYNKGKCINTLLTCGAKLASERAMNLETTELYQAILGRSIQALMVLKSYGLDIADKDIEGNTYLHYMAVNGFCKAMEFLLSFAVNIEAKNKMKYTPLHLAVIYNRINAAKVLLNHKADAYTETEDGMTAVHLAAIKGNVAFLDVLEEMKLNIIPKTSDFHGALPIHFAAKRGHQNVIAWYLKRGFDIDEASQLGFTPLMYAVMSMDLNCIDFLIHAGADVNKPCTTLNDITVLYKACHDGNADIVKFLISKGAHVNVQSDYRLTPLHAAAHCGQENIYKILVEAGADEGIVDCLGMTPRGLMERNGSHYSSISE
ncbi:hypothetical protein C0J52_00197 [Blattella germanica]|nr:hypothetical protein C0J52_00197 [Blattella germanica]